MGAWGPGSFENDDAMDLVAELLEGDAHQRLGSFFALADLEGYLEVPEAMKIVAAAELIAAACSFDHSRIPSEISSAIRDNSEQLKGLAPVGLAALIRVLEESELKSLWMEGDPEGLWVKSQSRILEALN